MSKLNLGDLVKTKKNAYCPKSYHDIIFNVLELSTNGVLLGRPHIEDDVGVWLYIHEVELVEKDTENKE